MAAVAVVEGLDVVEDHELGGGAGGRDEAAEAFGLEGGDEAFGQRVVVGIALAAHAAGDAPGGGELLEGVGGVLAAAIAVMDQARRRPLALRRRAAKVVVVSSARMSSRQWWATQRREQASRVKAR